MTKLSSNIHLLWRENQFRKEVRKTLTFVHADKSDD